MITVKYEIKIELEMDCLSQKDFEETIKREVNEIKPTLRALLLDDFGKTRITHEVKEWSFSNK